MSKPRKYRPVGTIWKPEDEKKDSSLGTIFGVIFWVVVALFLIGSCAG